MPILLPLDSRETNLDHSFSCDYDRLIKPGLLRELPFYLTAAVGKEQICQFFHANSSVFACELADLKGVLVINDVLSKPIVVVLPYPCLKRNAFSFVCLMNIGRRIRRLAQQKTVIVANAGDKDPVWPDLTGDAPDC